MQHLAAEVLRLLGAGAPGHLQAFADVLGQSAQNATEAEDALDHVEVSAVAAGRDDRRRRVYLQAFALSVHDHGARDLALVVHDQALGACAGEHFAAVRHDGAVERVEEQLLADGVVGELDH